VRRIVDYAISRGKRSFAALLPDNAYGAVVEAAFQQEVARRGGRVLAIEKYPLDPGKMAEPIRRVAQAAGRVDGIFIPDGADAVPRVVQTLTASGMDTKRVQLLGTGLWDDPRISRPRRWTAAGLPPPNQPVSAISQPAIVRASGRIRCAPRRSLMTPWRWSRG